MELIKVVVFIECFNTQTMESEKITFLGFLDKENNFNLNGYENILFTKKTINEIKKYLLSRDFENESTSEIKDIHKYKNSDLYYFNYFNFEYKGFEND